jgi:putative acetyltransferase
MTPLPIAIRPERAGDEPEIRRVVLAAFGGPDEADLVDALRASPAWIPALSLVALYGDRVVGHVLFTRATIEGAPSAIALAPLAVDPSRQRQGIGDALTRAGLAEARAMGERVAIVLGHPSYYPRFGFEPAVPRGLTSVFAQGEHAEAFMALALQPGALDGVRGRVDYAPAFGSFE